MNAAVLTAAVEFTEHRLVTPLVLSSGTISEATEARATVTVRAGNREAVGKGAILLSDLWAWPGGGAGHRDKDSGLRSICERLARDLGDFCGGEPAHPLELGLRLHQRACEEEMPGLAGEAPVLARAMCASPFDAAIHDAAGMALNRSAFALYDDDLPLPSADRHFAGGKAARAIRGVIEPPVTELEAWWIVGAQDSVAKDVRPAIERGGFRCFKLKLHGRDAAADVRRTAELHRELAELGVRGMRLTVDTNEANPDAESVREYLERLRAAAPEAFAALVYLEQPTSRRIEKAAFDWKRVCALKPVLIDEGLTGLEVLPLAKQQGWAGLALKTCKGHSLALTAAAWAKENGMLVALQDLTNPGYAAIHAALLASRVRTLNGVELNSPQFIPAANAPWLPRLGGLFRPAGGVHRLHGIVDAPGLGSTL